MGQIVYKTLLDGLSLNIDDNLLTVSSGEDKVFLNFSVNDKLCGIVIQKQDFEKIIIFLNKEIGGLL
jgi:hypothetical protein